MWLISRPWSLTVRAVCIVCVCVLCVYCTPLCVAPALTLTQTPHSFRLQSNMTGFVCICTPCHFTAVSTQTLNPNVLFHY